MTKLKTVLEGVCVHVQKHQPLGAPLLLGQQSCPVGLHLLQALGQVAVGHLHLLDLVQRCAQLALQFPLFRFELIFHLLRVLSSSSVAQHLPLEPADLQAEHTAR